MNKNLRELMNLMVRKYRELGLVEVIYGRGAVVKVKVGGVEVRVNVRELNEVLEVGRQRWSDRRFEGMDDYQILGQIKKLINIYPVVEGNSFEVLRNIDLEVERIEKGLYRRRGVVGVKEPSIKGKVHFRQKLVDKLRIFVSEHRVNYQSIYEGPLVGKLRDIWEYGRILPNFCVIEVYQKGVKILFELDAVSIVKENIYIFEIKNSKFKETEKELEHIIEAGCIIGIWQEKMKNKLKRVYPVLYFRDENREKYEKYNVINYRDLLLGEGIDISSMISYNI